MKKCSSLSLSHLAVLGGCNFLHAVNTNSMHFAQCTLIQFYIHFLQASVEDISLILTAVIRTGQMGKGWGWWVGWPTKAKHIINVCTNYNWFGIFVCWNFQHFALNQTRISLGFLSAEMFSIFFQTKLDLVWNKFASKFDTIIFQTKLDLVWKSSSIIWGFLATLVALHFTPVSN